MNRSARAASLQSYREPYVKRRLISRSLLSRSTFIARSHADNELNTYINNYNAGLVSNVDFLPYFQKAYVSGLFSPSEKASIQKRILEFENKVRGERLEAVYKNTSDNSVERIEAAMALANFYKLAAAKMEDGTPAQSDMLQRVGVWTNKAEAEKTQVLKADRKRLRAEQFLKVSQLEPGTIEELQGKVDAYRVLANQARADGDNTEAIRMETQAQQELNKIPILQGKITKAEKRIAKQDRQDMLNKIKDAYHDGQITAYDAIKYISTINDEAVMAYDSTHVLHINNLIDSLQRNIEKEKIKKNKII